MYLFITKKTMADDTHNPLVKIDQSFFISSSFQMQISLRVKEKNLSFSTNSCHLCILTSAFSKLKLFFSHLYKAFFTAIRDQNSQFLYNINHKIIHKSEDIDLINLIFSTNGHLLILCLLLTSAFARLFFLHFNEAFFYSYTIPKFTFSL